MRKRYRRRRANKRKRMIRRIGISAGVILLLSLCLCLWLLLNNVNPSEEGIEYLKNGQYEEAIGQFEQAIKDEVNVGDAYRGIGIAKWEQEDYEGAREAFQKALENRYGDHL